MAATTRTFVLGLACLGALHAGDREPAPNPIPPASKPAPLVTKVQTDDFSCGFLALAAIYESYGLDPEAARLWERLGTNVPAVPFLKDSNGTLQPDLFRVLRQDGFATEVIHPSATGSSTLIATHLTSGHYALALTETERAGGLHWVVLTGFESGEVIIGDSLATDLVRKNLLSYCNGPLLRAILLTPRTPNPDAAYGREHAAGLTDMLGTAWQVARSVVVATVLLLIVVIFCLWYLVRKRFKKRAAKRNEFQT